ncbi:MAG: adenylate/guanylate cyclase domain-containing protein [Proteobacteria bacterium]|nr:adenylate/guanylate cyclase domain-containing protein [Pseudomonadota bacterium]
MGLPSKLLRRLAHAPRALVGGAIIALFAVPALAPRFNLPLVPKLEAIAYDARLALTRPNTGDPQVVIVDVDEASLAREGRWPWSRDKMAHLVTELFDRYHVRAIGFDVVFAEPDTSSGSTVVDQLAKSTFADAPRFAERWRALRPLLDYDQQFARALTGRLTVLALGFNATDQRVNALPAPAFTTRDLGGHVIPISAEAGYTANLPLLAAAATMSGHFDPTFDADNLIRRVPMVKRYGDGFFPALSLALAATVLESKAITPHFDSNGDLDGLDLGGLLVPTAADGTVLVPYRGPERTFHYVSAASVLAGDPSVTGLEGAVAIFGTSAKGLQDLRSTPLAPDFPGVEIHANLLSGMLNDDLRSVPRGAHELDALVMVVAGLVVVFGISWRRPVVMLVGIAGVAAAVVGLNLYFWIAQRAVVPIAATLVMLAVLLVYNLLTGFVRQVVETRHLSDQFGEYVPPERVAEMRESGRAFSLEGEARELTVMFSDVRQFTAVSERLSPRDLSAMMNAYLTAMTEAIHGTRGTIDKYIGDAIMAFWGAPVPSRTHARDAVHAALAMRDTMPKLGPVFESRGWPELSIGIGINTGTMNVGDMGSRFRRAYTVLGDAVNLASRVENLTKLYGVVIICGEATREAAPDFVWREIDRVRVQNRAAPVTIWEPLGVTIAPSQQARLDRWNAALALYRARQFGAAADAFAALEGEDVSTTLYTVYRERCEGFMRSPPPVDWDGATSTFK